MNSLDEKLTWWIKLSPRWQIDKERHRKQTVWQRQFGRCIYLVFLGMKFGGTVIFPGAKLRQRSHSPRNLSGEFVRNSKGVKWGFLPLATVINHCNRFPVLSIEIDSYFAFLNAKSSSAIKPTAIKHSKPEQQEYKCGTVLICLAKHHWCMQIWHRWWLWVAEAELLLYNDLIKIVKGIRVLSCPHNNPYCVFA